VYGLLLAPRDELNVLPVDLADTWLHLCLGIVMTGLCAILPWPSTDSGTVADRATPFDGR